MVRNPVRYPRRTAALGVLGGAAVVAGGTGLARGSPWWGFLVLLGVGLLVVAVALPGRPGAPGPDPTAAAALSVDEAVRTLADARGYAVPGVRVGVAALTLPTSAAFFRLCEAGPAVRPQVEYLLRHATPGGRIYAAQLLQRLDPAAARVAWQRMAGDPTGIEVVTGGCTGFSTTTVGELAASLADC
jgi:hypothetical protein